MDSPHRYGTVGFAHEQDAFLQQAPPAPRRIATKMPWVTLAVGAAVGLAGLGYCASLQSTLVSQQTMLVKMQQQLESMHAVVLDKSAVVSASKKEKTKEKDVKFQTLPHKFAVEYATPLKTQDNRGTCWDFATVAVLEYTYREQGIREGWLKEDEYLALSEQAYGAEVLRLCSGPAGSPQQVACLIPGNEIWKNSTEGGESAELYYLVNGLKDAIFPVSICPYQADGGNDTRCDGLEQKRSKNPLSLSVKKLETYYEETTTKQALVRDRRAMAFTTSMPYITHYYPCIGELTKDARCDPAGPSCTLCPSELSATTCCIPETGGSNFNMHGEFIASSGMTLEGGHVMTLVGYNDQYRSKDGFTGGYILKNSWWDGIHPALGPMHARGSHSMQYWLQEISDWEERSMCPNSFNPENWYQCGNVDAVIHANKKGGDVGARVPLATSTVSAADIDSCLSEETKLYAETNLQPLHLQCTDATFCDTTNANLTYFVRNMTAYGDRMQRICLFAYDAVTTNASEVCLPPMTIEKIAYVLSPIESEVRANDPDACGFYWYPYEIQQQYNSLFGNFYVNNYDIEWAPQSFAANKNEFPDLDYTDVEASTKTQNRYTFVGPFPFAKVVPEEAWHGGEL